MKKFLVILSIFALAASIATAHEFIVKPAAPSYKNGDTVNLNVLSTHYFMVGEELEPANMCEVYVLQGGKKAPLSLKPNEKDQVYEASFKLSGDAPAVVVGHRKGILYSSTTKGGQDGSRKELTAKGFNVLKTTKYEKFSKTYINPSASDASFAQPIGQVLEIVPVTNPADFAKGKAATFKVLYNGQPVKAEVAATYDGFNSKEENAYALTGASNNDGLVTIIPTAPGIWMVRTSVSAADNSADYDDISLRSIVVFSVK